MPGRERKLKGRLLPLALCLLSVGCDTSYQPSPETTKIATKVATARRSVQHAQDVTANIEATAKLTQSHATTTAGHIEASLDAIAKHDYTTAAQELISAKASNELVQMMLQQSLRDVVSLRKSLGDTESDLADAQEEVGKLKGEIEKMALQGAKDRAVVQEVNWGFRIGALLYFVKGILKMGFIGSLILVGLFIVLLCIGGPAALFAMNSVRTILGWLRSRKSVK